MFIRDMCLVSVSFVLVLNSPIERSNKTPDGVKRRLAEKPVAAGCHAPVKCVLSYEEVSILDVVVTESAD